jgi:hypothetical protein
MIAYAFWKTTGFGGDMAAELKIVVILLLIIAEYYVRIVQIGLFQRRLEVVFRLRTFFAVSFIVHFRPNRPAYFTAALYSYNGHHHLAIRRAEIH